MDGPKAESVEPHLIVIVGATGDLTRRKLLPAVYRLIRKGFMAGKSRVLGVARTALDDASFRDWARQALSDDGVPADEFGDWCDQCLFYQPLAEGDADGYRQLAARIEAIEQEAGLPGNRMFYLALPPSAFGPTVEGLGGAGLNRSAGWTRLVVEKPFGSDLKSARALNATIHRFFDERQVYRIDHYLGKETVQNLLVFRFSNVVFESLWNRDKVASVQITVAEEIGVGDRAGYYDRAGALRDIVQNHLTQLLTLVAMEVPVAYDAESVRYEKIKVLRAVERLRPEDVVLGQYARGMLDGEEVPGYLEEEGVAPGSRTETYVAAKLAVDTWRWQGVPFYVRTGKRLPKRLTQIAVAFRRPPIALFESMECAPSVHSNLLLIRLQPDEGFELYFDVKRPGEPLRLKKLPLSFEYKEAFGEIPDAYETLLLDVLLGDQTLFVHADEVEASWRLWDPIATFDLPVHLYAAGTWGPSEAEELLARGGHRWRGALAPRGQSEGP